jgi:8-oxo-dGTP diphosphatase
MLLATLCYVKHDGCTLMVLRNKKPNDIHAGKWNGLGGKFEAGESPEQCVVREVREESGLEIHAPRMHGLLMFPNFKSRDWYVFVFTAREFNGDLIDSPEGRLEWIPDGSLNGLDLWPSDLVFLPWLEQGRFFSARFTYDGEAMREHEVHFYNM